MAAERVSTIESVDRALRLLQELSLHGSGAALDELATATGLPKSSVHRTLSALRTRGFAAQTPEGRYLVGSEVLRVAFGFHERVDVRVVFRGVLERIRDDVNETVHLGVLDGGDVVYLDKLESTHSVKTTSLIGGRNPAHCTGVGKALLAWTFPTDDAVRAWIAERGVLEGRTPRSITDPERLVAEMARIRAAGFATDLEESEAGVRCLGVPLFLGGPRPRAAVSISAPKERLPRSRMRSVAAALVDHVGGTAA